MVKRVNPAELPTLEQAVSTLQQRAARIRDPARLRVVPLVLRGDHLKHLEDLGQGNPSRGLAELLGLVD